MTHSGTKNVLFRLSGPVVPGDSRGRLIGFPTLNVDTDTSEVQSGVYAGYLVMPEKDLPALIHLGPRPTVGDSNSRLEIHVISFPDGVDFDRVEVYGVGFIRGVLKFDSVQALSEQLQRDKMTALEKFFPSEF